jgi:hypothetical protein
MVFDLLINLLMSRHLIMTWLDFLAPPRNTQCRCVCSKTNNLYLFFFQARWGDVG